MRVLVTGGTGVIGEGLLAALLRHGHEVRLLARSARREAPAWPEGVEPWPGDVTRPATLRGAADGCGAVVHVTGIVLEQPPERTYARVNVGGTRHVLAEAARAGVPRFVYVSSLGADRGQSGYHRSKLEAETLARRYHGEWVIVRPGNVYGPGDEIVSWILKMVRSLPAVPVVAGGEQPFEPIWYADLGEAIALCVDRRGVAGRVLELVGPDRTSMNDLLQRLRKVTDRAPLRVPVPAIAARAGVKVLAKLGVAKKLGLDLPVGDAQLTMLEEGNVLQPGAANGLKTLRLKATPLDDGLAQLVELMPEQLPQEGVGPLRRKRYRAEVKGAARTALALQRLAQSRLGEVMPLEVGREKGTPRRLAVGTTFSVTLPVRGVLSMRVIEIVPGRFTACTVGGHPLAGVVSFKFEDAPRKRLGVEVEVHARSADVIDGVVMQTIGAVLQDSNWRDVVQRLVDLSGGEAPDGVQTSEETLDEPATQAAEAWIAKLVQKRRRGTRQAAVAGIRPEAGPRSPRSRRRGTGSARRSRAGTGSARTTGRSARPAAARTGSRRPT